MASIGVIESGTIQVNQILNFDLALSAAGKYVVQLEGPAQVELGVYQGFVTRGTGKLRVCGAGALGNRTLDAAPHIIQCKGLTAGDFSFLIRHWTFPDYYQFKFLFFWGNKHPSTC